MTESTEAGQSTRDAEHTGLKVGLGCLGISVGPLLVVATLQSVFGMFPGNNGLGLGLWMWLSGPVALLVLIIGVMYDERQNKRKTEGRGVLPF